MYIHVKKSSLPFLKSWLLDGGLSLLQYLIFPKRRGDSHIPESHSVGFTLHIDVIRHAGLPSTCSTSPAYSVGYKMG